MGLLLTGISPAAARAKEPAGTVSTAVSTFHGGRTTTADSGPVLAVDHRQRPLVATTSGPFLALARYTKKAKLDRKFSGDGVARVKIRKNLSVSDIAIDSRRRILLVGSSNASSGERARLIVVRLTKKGKPDKSFGRRGIVTVDHASGTAITIDPAGRLIVSGRSRAPSAALVTRLGESGSPDTSFGIGGSVRLSVYGPQETASVGTSAGEVVIDAANRVIVELRVFRGIGQPSETGLARFTPGGVLDDTFGAAGGYTSSTLGLPATGAVSRGIVARSDGGFAVAGTTHGQFFLQRFDIDGLPSSAPVLTDVTSGYLEGGNAMTADSHGRVLSVGDSFPTLAALRYRSDGSLDTGFAANGVYRATKLKGTRTMSATDVTVDARGRIWVTGLATAKGARSDRVVILRLTDDGRPDRTWRSRTRD
ncbi:hypothetical protein RB608_12610 [Nocardioides sp. LHD-245]|uniref:hypothetical protein n=1 Tax=Nocardioides sp. LHD-245 TaxID=3051387 RepID=UPI0027E0A799|nr:hypothetical protein [Nocardioides sp. LHD-245]